jgi:hypothetical protein
MQDVDAFVYLLEWYFTKEASEKIFDMAFSVYRSDKWKCEHRWGWKTVQIGSGR